MIYACMLRYYSLLCGTQSKAIIKGPNIMHLLIKGQHNQKVNTIKGSSKIKKSEDQKIIKDQHNQRSKYNAFTDHESPGSGAKDQSFTACRSWVTQECM